VIADKVGRDLLLRIAGLVHRQTSPDGAGANPASAGEAQLILAE
jgi:hypothetical protein